MVKLKTSSFVHDTNLQYAIFGKFVNLKFIKKCFLIVFRENVFSGFPLEKPVVTAELTCLSKVYRAFSRRPINSYIEKKLTEN